MIRVEQELCAGCGLCVDECPSEAISLVDGVVSIDANSCNGCTVCVDVCPNQALAWIVEPVTAEEAAPRAIVLDRSPISVVDLGIPTYPLWRRAVLPAVTGALSWVGSEVVPRLAPLALDALEGALDRRLSTSPRDHAAGSFPVESKVRGKGRRHRHRKGRSK